jgi:NADPH2:quinone reductase
MNHREGHSENYSGQQVAEEVLVVTHVFDAPQVLVFKAWTEPDRVMRWWGPRDFTAPFCKIDLRVGGIFLNCMRSPEGREFWSQGIYRTIMEPERLVFTDTFADSEGRPVPPEQYGMSPDWPAEAIVDVTLAERAGKTRVTVRHSPLPQGPERELCQQGWNESLEKLGDYLAEDRRRSWEAAKSRVEPKMMRAVAINRFGGPEVLKVETRPVPEVGPDEVLIRIESAGVGVWDPYEVEGGFARLFQLEPKFPYVPGSDCAGIVIAIGKQVKRFKKGDRVYAFTLLNSKGGSYAEYVAVKADNVALIPGTISTDEAGAMPVDAITALRGLDDTLRLKKGESLMIFGASGGIGHLAVQLAKRMGARVFAVASGGDGVALVKRLGADVVVDGHKDDVITTARQFAPAGFDCALITAGGDAAQEALAAVREGGRVAYPNGVEPEPQIRSGVSVQSYDGTPDPQAIEKLNRLIESGPFLVHIDRTFSLDEIAEAHRALESHHLGKLALRPR